MADILVSVNTIQMNEVQMEKIAVGEPNWMDYWQNLDPSQPIALQQHYIYLAVLASYGADIDIYIFKHRGQVIALAPMVRRNFYRFIQLNSCFRGPIFCQSDTPPQIMGTVYRLLLSLSKKWRWQFVNIQPAMPVGPEAQKVLKSAGLKQVMTGFSTAWLDLRISEDSLRQNLVGKWRNQLNKAYKGDFSVTHSFDKQKNYNWLLDQELNHARIKGYPPTPKGLIYTYEQMSKTLVGAAEKSILALSAFRRREKLAGGLFLIHGKTATYQIGWTSDVGRQMNAQNRILWDAMMILKAEGVNFLDLGGFETAKLASLARFKLGTGAKAVTYCGSYM